MFETTLRAQLTWYALIGSFLCFVVQVGGSFYERVVIDVAWPERLDLIRVGGVNRKLFWIPVHAVATLLLPIALFAGWNRPELRWPVGVAVALYLVMRIWSSLYFIPAALQFETGVNTQEDQARTWVRLTLLRLPLILGSTVALWIALKRMLLASPGQ